MKVKVLIILLLLLLPTVVHAKKIGEGDEWVYDDGTTLYSEKALKTVQKQTGDTFTSFTEVNTSRPFPFIYSYLTPRLELSLSSNNDGVIYVSQEGGLPIYTNRIFEGYIALDGVQIPVNSSASKVDIDGDIEDAFISTQTTSYIRRTWFDLGTIVNASENYFYIEEQYVIATNNNIEDKVRNFTMSLLSSEIELSYNNTIIKESEGGGLTLNAIDLSVAITIDDLYAVPTYIGQTEPLNVEGLSLNQVSIFKEYFLVIETETETETTDEEKADFLFVFAIIYLLIILPNTNRRR